MDKQKRKTLKLMGAGATIAGISVAGGQALAAISPVQSAEIYASQLQIDLFTGSTVPEDTVILQNRSNQPIVIERFLPGIVSLKDKMIDLNELCAHHPVIIEPGRQLSTTVAQWQLLAKPMSREYLWADNSAALIGEGTEVVTVSASVINRQANLYVPVALA